MDWRRRAGYEWADEFNTAVRVRMRAHEHAALIDYQSLHAAANGAIPTPEHYLPLLYVLAQQDGAEPLEFFNDELVMGSVSMLSVWVGA
jgi:4,5-DOPA dioxygenase extradiol